MCSFPKRSLKLVFNLMLFFLFKTDASAQASPSIKVLEKKYAFEALPLEERTEYLELKEEVEKTFLAKKYCTSLVKLMMAEEIFNEDPQMFFIRGLCYAELHDSENAALAYKEALEIHPDSPIVNASLLEVYFLARDYEKSLMMSDKLRTIYLAGQNAFPQKNVPLLEFKRLLAITKLLNDQRLLNNWAKRLSQLFDHVDGAPFVHFNLMLRFLHSKDRALALVEEIDELSKLYGYMDDTPYSYFAQALSHYRVGNKEKGDIRMNVAVQVFGGKKVLPWTKAMTDTGYVDDYDFSRLLEFATSSGEKE